jgi:hypothetical protein
MMNWRGWEPAFMLSCVRFIRFLTQRLVSLCELSTPVYVPVARVSRVFCFEGISVKPLSIMTFWDITVVKPA